jgi:hypothetical protein
VTYQVLRRGPQHDEGLRPHYLATGAEPVDDPLEVLHIGDSNPYHRVRISRCNEDGDDLGNVVSNAGNGVHSLAAGETDLGERLQRLTKLGVVEANGVARDHSYSLEPIYSALHCRSRQPDLGADVTQRPARVLLEQIDHKKVDRVNFFMGGVHAIIISK